MISGLQLRRNPGVRPGHQSIAAIWRGNPSCVSWSNTSPLLSLGPGTEDNGLAGPLDESLAGKGRRVPAPMNPGPRAALFGDRCHTEVALHASDLWIEFRMVPKAAKSRRASVGPAPGNSEKKAFPVNLGESRLRASGDPEAHMTYLATFYRSPTSQRSVFF